MSVNHVISLWKNGHNVVVASSDKGFIEALVKWAEGKGYRAQQASSSNTKPGALAEMSKLVDDVLSKPK